MQILLFAGDKIKRKERKLKRPNKGENPSVLGHNVEKIGRAQDRVFPNQQKRLPVRNSLREKIKFMACTITHELEEKMK